MFDVKTFNQNHLWMSAQLRSFACRCTLAELTGLPVSPLVHHWPKTTPFFSSLHNYLSLACSSFALPFACLLSPPLSHLHLTAACPKHASLRAWMRTSSATMPLALLRLATNPDGAHRRNYSPHLFFSPVPGPTRAKSWRTSAFATPDLSPRCPQRLSEHCSIPRSPREGLVVGFALVQGVFAAAW